MKNAFKNIMFVLAGCSSGTLFLYNYTQNDFWHRMANGFFLILGVVAGILISILLTLIFIAYVNRKKELR